MNDDIHEALSYIREARQWMQAEKSRQSAVRMRQEDWDFLIARLIEAEALLTHTEDNDENHDTLTGFAEAWKQVLAGDTHDISTLWDDFDDDNIKDDTDDTG